MFTSLAPNWYTGAAVPSTSSGEGQDHPGDHVVSRDEIERHVLRQDLHLPFHHQVQQRRARVDPLAERPDGEVDARLAARRPRDGKAQTAPGDDLLPDRLRVRDVDVRPAPVGRPVEATLDEALRDELTLHSRQLGVVRLAVRRVAALEHRAPRLLGELALTERVLARCFACSLMRFRHSARSPGARAIPEVDP